MIVIRCDSSSDIGTGHVFRCLNLASALRLAGRTATFVCSRISGHINHLIRDRGFSVDEIEPDETGIKDVQLILNKKPDWVIVDHYLLSEDWEKNLYDFTKIMAIDDLMTRRHRCHILLDQNFRKDYQKYESLVLPGTRILTGPKFALLPPDISKGRVKKTGEKSKLLAFFGGADKTNETLRLIEAAAGLPTSMELTIVILNSHFWLTKLKDVKLPDRVQLQISPKNWHELLSDHDFFIGSGGTVTWERMYLGLPGAVVAVAPNQETPNKDLAEAGYQIYLGRASEVNYLEVLRSISVELKAGDLFGGLSKRGLTLVDRFDPKVLDLFS